MAIFANAENECTQIPSNELNYKGELTGFSLVLNDKCLPDNGTYIGLVMATLKANNLAIEQKQLLMTKLNAVDISDTNQIAANLNSVLQAYGLSVIKNQNVLYLHQNRYVPTDLTAGKTVINLTGIKQKQ